MSKIHPLNYPPFGSTLPTRSWSDASRAYRYGFNGKEKDSELANDEYDFGARIYDGRLGRWLSLDPLMKKYPMISTYSFCNNSPLYYIDPDGCDILPANVDKTGVILKKPVFLDDVSNTQFRAQFVWNATTNEFDLKTNITVSFSIYFKTKGANGKTLEGENPGLLNQSEIHEDVHVERYKLAINHTFKYDFTKSDSKPLVKGLGGKSYEGTIDEIMTNMYKDYVTVRLNEKQEYLDKKTEELKNKYNPQILKAEKAGDIKKVNRLKNELKSKSDKLETDYEKETQNGVNKINKTLLDDLVEYARQLNKHSGPNGVSKEASDKMSGRSKEIQDGKVPVTWQKTTILDNPENE